MPNPNACAKGGECRCDDKIHPRCMVDAGHVIPKSFIEWSQKMGCSSKSDWDNVRRNCWGNHPNQCDNSCIHFSVSHHRNGEFRGVLMPWICCLKMGKKPIPEAFQRFSRHVGCGGKQVKTQKGVLSDVQ